MFSVHWLGIRVVGCPSGRNRNRVRIGSGCLLGPALGKETSELHPTRRLFYGVHFVSERLHSLQHGRLKHPHLLLKLDVKMSSQGFF